MKLKVRFLTFFLLLTFSLSGLAKPVFLTDMQIWKPAELQIRLVFSLSARITHNIFSLSSPLRLVIDLKNTKLVNKLAHIPASPLIHNIRSASRHENDLRVVLDLNEPVRTKSFFLNPERDESYRLVVDISMLRQPETTLSSNTFFSKLKEQILQKPLEVKIHQKSQPSISELAAHQRDVIIAIDAGHGGIDSGALGPTGLQEKNVALAISKQLATLVAAEQGMKAVLIRNGDYFIKLHKRVELARRYQTDLFISIHADAYPEDINVQGTSVYMLSRRGASSEQAKWLAEKENAADLIGGVTLNDKDDLLAQVLLDLSQFITLETSTYIAQQVFKALQKVSKTHSNRVQRAGFLVLRAPDIPSILVETGFISNPREEEKLSDPNYQRRLAGAIMKGIRKYFADYPPPGTLLAHR
jgi:N-acetylmuramoyl-L-alanine amidase